MIILKDGGTNPLLDKGATFTIIDGKQFEKSE